MVPFNVLQQILDEGTHPWGVNIQRVEMYVYFLFIKIHQSSVMYWIGAYPFWWSDHVPTPLEESSQNTLTISSIS